MPGMEMAAGSAWLASPSGSMSIEICVTHRPALQGELYMWGNDGGRSLNVRDHRGSDDADWCHGYSSLSSHAIALRQGLDTISYLSEEAKNKFHANVLANRGSRYHE